MRMFELARSAAAIAERTGTDWLKAHPVAAYQDRDGKLHTDECPCVAPASAMRPVEVELHRSHGRWCPRSPLITLTHLDWVELASGVAATACALNSADLPAPAALDACYAATLLGDSLKLRRVGDDHLRWWADQLATTALARLAGASDDERTASIEHSRQVVADRRRSDPAFWNDDRDDWDWTVVMYRPDRPGGPAPAALAPWALHCDGRRIVAVVPHVVALAVVAEHQRAQHTFFFADQPPEVRYAVHLEPVAEPIDAAELQIAFQLWAELGDPARAWAAFEALVGTPAG